MSAPGHVVEQPAPVAAVRTDSVQRSPAGTWVPGERRVTLGLAALLVAAGLTYVAGALPHAGTLYSGDEANFMEATLRLGSGVLEPFGLRHGMGTSMILLLEYGAMYGWLRLTGQVARPVDLAWRYVESPELFVLAGRLTALIAALGLMWMVYRLGRRLYSSATGMIAAAWVGSSVMTLSMVVRFKEDLPAAWLLMAGLWCAARLAGFGGVSTTPRRHAVLAGLAVGAAASIKYTAGLGALCVALACWWAPAAGRPVRARLGYLAAAGLAALGAFLALMPALVTHPHLFIQGVRDLTFGFTEFPQQVSPTWVRFTRHLPDGLGLPLTILIAIGGLAALRRDRRVALFLLAYPAALAWFLRPYVGVASYLMLGVPCAALLAAAGLEHVVQGTVRRPVLAAWVAALVAAAAAWPMASDGWRLTAVMRRPDTRQIAREWIETHIPSGTRIMAEGMRHQVAALGVPLAGTEETWQQDLAQIEAGGGRGQLFRMRHQFERTRPPKAAYALSKVFVATPELLAAEQPQYVVTSGYFDLDAFAGEPPGIIESLPCHKPGFLEQRLALREALARGYDRVAQFDPGVRFHEEFPHMYSGDYRRLRAVPLFGRRDRLFQGPIVTVYRRRAA